MFKVIVAGSRTFGDYELLKNFVDMKLSRIKEYEEIEIVSGGAGGADMIYEARKQGLKVAIKRF